MIFVTSQTVLSQVFGNEIAVVEGEQTLFDKITLELETSENWLMSQVIGTPPPDVAAQNTTFKNMCVTIIACDAMSRAIPALDLVLTPNGFGVVQNNNVVPASKERVERLIASCIERRDFTLSRLYAKLATLNYWQGTLQQKEWANSPLQNFDDVDSWKKRKEYDSRYEALLAMRNEAAPFVTRLSSLFISAIVMARVSLALCSNDASEDAANDRLLAQKLARIILRYLNTEVFHHSMVDPIVDYLRNNDAEWRASDVAEFYEVPVFQNTKESKGYFF